MRAWTPLEQQVFERLQSSGATFALPQSQWPSWATGAKWERILAYAVAPNESAPSTLTTGMVAGRLLTERYDSRDEAPYNYNWYLVVRSAAGRLYQSGPHRDVDVGHQLRQPASDESLGIARCIIKAAV